MENTDEQKGVDWRIVADSVICSAVLTSTDGQLQQCQYCGKSARINRPITHIDWCAFMAASRLLGRAEGSSIVL